MPVLITWLLAVTGRIAVRFQTVGTNPPDRSHDSHRPPAANVCGLIRSNAQGSRRAGIPALTARDSNCNVVSLSGILLNALFSVRFWAVTLPIKLCSFCGRRRGAGSLLTCQGARTTPSRHHTEAGTLRKRAQRACTECHTHKTRCSGDLPRCKRCETCNLQCEYAPAKRKFQHVPVIAASSRAESDDAPAQPTSAHDALSPEISTTGPNGTPPSMHSLTTE